MTTICYNCKFVTHTTYPTAPEFICIAPNVPPTDYIRGISYCHNINTNGECPYFKKKIVKITEPKKSFWRLFFHK